MQTQTTASSEIAEIAKKHLGVPTLETRNSDSLDFYNVSVWAVKAALEEAFAAGQRAGAAPAAEQLPVGGGEAT